jgi:hypothetical protein
MSYLHLQTIYLLYIVKKELQKNKRVRVKEEEW